MGLEHDFKAFPELRNSQLDEFYLDSPHYQIFDNFDARVVRVHDGDTVTLKVPFRDFEFPLRMAYIQAPELDESGGKRSRDWLTREVDGKNIEVVMNRRNRVGRWGRLIGTIKVDGLDINELSMGEGFSRRI